jgi:hypothetical protein
MAENTPSSEAMEPDDLNEVADRLEAALDRIVRHLDAAPPGASRQGLPPDLARRLDLLIARLRRALAADGGAPDPGL